MKHCPKCNARESGLGWMSNPLNTVRYTCGMYCKPKPRSTPLPAWMVNLTLECLNRTIWTLEDLTNELLPKPSGFTPNSHCIGDTILVKRPARWVTGA